MITGRRAHFERRLRQRGYTLDEVRGCIVSQDGDQITVDETHPDYPRAPKPGAAPSLLQKAKNFAQAAVSHVASGMPRASDEEIERRFAICQGCEFYKDNACQKCGCPVNREKKLISKLAWADQKCPVGHW